MLATFEIVFRSGLPPLFIADMNSTPEGWRGWTNIICVDAEVEDVAILGWAAAEDHRELRGRARAALAHTNHLATRRSTRAARRGLMSFGRRACRWVCHSSAAPPIAIATSTPIATSACGDE